LIHNTSRPSESAERQPTLPTTATAPGKPRQRKSRFDKPEPRKEPSPVSDKGMIASQSETSNMQAATPPPLTREPSVQSLQDEVPPPPPSSLPAHPGNAVAPSRSGQRSGNRWSNDTRGTLEQPQEHIGLPPAPDPTSLSYRLSNDKSRVRQGGRDEGGNEGEVELSFQNAHAELEREPEEMVFQQERLERPQVQRRGASLLDRLSTSNNPRSHDSAAQQSLRDRLIPSKREFEDMTDEHDVLFDGEDGNESKRARRKNGRARTRGGRRSGPA